jgi:DNA-binding PadR family transcriptional regulator
MLEDEGLVTSVDDGGKRRYTLTDAGREAADQLGGALPWEAVAGSFDPAALRLHDEIHRLAIATMQLAGVGTPEQNEEVERLLADARKRIYAILAAE